jgi:NAD(P)-dependent dehydrogenase (short-subunit alcohol dehydrogenase family)
MTESITDRGCVFVTGCSTGIGRATVDLLAKEGYSVVAGVRKESDAPESAASVAVLDLGVADSITPACEGVLAFAMDRGGLVGVVNNAGFIVNGPGELLSVDDWRRQFEVNFFGALTVAKALLPALGETRGCLVNVGSVGGRISLPFLGPYSASKFAMRAWSDALRLELRPHGVRVVLIEPGAIATPIWAKGQADADEMESTLGEGERTRYGAQIVSMRNLARFAERNAVAPEEVASVIAGAIGNPNPNGRYLVGRDAFVQSVVAVLPTALQDMLLGLLMKEAGEGGRLPAITAGPGADAEEPVSD